MNGEEIHYRLNEGCSDFLRIEDKHIIIQAFRSLPEPIIEWALDNLVFFSGSSQYIPIKEILEWTNRGFRGFILVDPNLCKKHEKEQTFEIAHEIAHARLNHHFYSTPDEQQENKADHLANLWLEAQLCLTTKTKLET